jgi:hypothetical protein
LNNYAERKGMSHDEAVKWLRPILEWALKWKM